MGNVLSNLYDAICVISDRISKGFTKASSHYDTKSLQNLVSKGRGNWSYKESIVAYVLYQSYKARVPFGQGIGTIYKPQPKDFNFTNPKRVYIEKEHISFYYPYDPELTATLRKSMNLVWHTKTGSHRVKTSYENIRSALVAVAEHDFDIDNESLDFANSMADLYNKNIEDSRADSADFEVDGLLGTPYPYQKAGIRYAINAEKVIIADAMGLGKAITLDSKILTPTGYCLMKDVCIGDSVINSSGGVSKITGVFPQGEEDVYKVTFTDGSFVECCDDHLWATNTPSRIHRGSEFMVRPLKEIRQDLTYSNGNLKHYIPITNTITSFQTQCFNIDPYFLGILLGDGCLSSRTIQLPNTDREIIEYSSSYLKNEELYLHTCKSGKDFNVSKIKGNTNVMKIRLTELGLIGKKSHDKYIPNMYLINGVETRLSILQGLMDTNGYVMKDGTIQFTSVSSKLIEGVSFIVHSFGGVVRKSQKTGSYKKDGKLIECQVAYTLTINLPQGVIPFRLTRKIERLKSSKKHNPSRGIKSIEYVGKQLTQCIAVDSVDHLYLTNDMVVTHNTLQALATIEAVKAYPAVIVAPASLKLNWEKEIRKWLPNKSTIVMDTSTKPQDLVGNDFIIVNYEVLFDARISNGNKFKKIPYQAVVFDESHYIKSKEAKRTIAAIKLAKKARYRINLTGTPIVNRPSDLIPQLQALDRLNEFGGWEQFVLRYCDAKKTPFGWDISGSSNLQELNEKLRATCYVRREKQDVLKELPPKNRIIVPMEMKPSSSYHEIIDAAQRSIMRQIGLDDTVDIESLSKKQKQEIRDGLNEIVLKSTNMVEIDALKLAVAKSKLDNVISWIRNFIDNGEKLIVFAYHKDIQNSLLRVFRRAARLISGDSQKEREAQKEIFMTDPNCKLLIGGMGNITSSPAGMGHTLTASSNVAFVEFGWNSAIHDQCEDRVHRISQTSDSVNIYYLIVEGTIEEEVVRLIEEKRRMIEQSVIGKEMVAIQEITNDLAKYLFS